MLGFCTREEKGSHLDVPVHFPFGVQMVKTLGMGQQRQEIMFLYTKHMLTMNESRGQEAPFVLLSELPFSLKAGWSGRDVLQDTFAKSAGFLQAHVL